MIVIDEPHQFGVVLTCERCGYKKLYTCTEGEGSGHGTSFTKDDVAFAKEHLSEDMPWICKSCSEARSARGVNQPPELRDIQGKTIEFTHRVGSGVEGMLMIYFTDGTYMMVKGDYLEYAYIKEEMGS